MPPSKSLGRPRADLRAVLNAIRFVTRSGAQWRMVPRDLVPWGTAWSYFRRWRDDGTWQRLHDHLRAEVRRAAGRDPQPSAAILDSQSVKTVERGGLERGFDGGKLIKGRKRHLLVDTLGLMHGLLVHSAGVQDRAGGRLLLRNAGRLAGIPGVLIHGRLDLSGPADTAWELAQAWPDAELVILNDSGHQASDSKRERILSALGQFARR